MISHAVADQIKRLLAEERYSQRQIARMTGVSRGTVGAIASGKRPDYEQMAAERVDDPFAGDTPKRCPGCGALALVHRDRKICLACCVRRDRELGKLSRPPERPDQETPVELELDEGADVRYQRIRRTPQSEFRRVKSTGPTLL